MSAQLSKGACCGQAVRNTPANKRRNNWLRSHHQPVSGELPPARGHQTGRRRRLGPSRASAGADSYDGVRALTVDELLAADDVELVLNLTIPAAHAEVALRAIAAGKSIYGEKPLAATTAEARQVLDAARTAGVAVGCAPDTVLGTGIQTARKAIDDGLIGRPRCAAGFPSRASSCGRTVCTSWPSN
jgi:predicted dehydrogenase